MKTCKFGGSCTTNSVNLRNIKNILKDKKRKIIVFSAIGKINNKNNKLTDYLLDFYEEKSISNKNIILNKIKEIFIFLKQKTNSKININYYLKKIRNSHDKDYVVSRGEDLTARMMAEFLGLKYIPAERLLIFGNGHINKKRTGQKVQNALRKYKRFCTGGFYGYDEGLKKIILLERGGGDVSGAIFAKVSGSKIYENYTDVEGVKMANPNFVSNPKTIKKVSYKDLKIVCSTDGKVLHKDVCDILENTNILTIVKNIAKPNGKKTKVCSTSCKCKFVCCKTENGKAQFFVKNKKKMENVIVSEDQMKETYGKLYSAILKE